MRRQPLAILLLASAIMACRYEVSPIILTAIAPSPTLPPTASPVPSATAATVSQTEIVQTVAIVRQVSVNVRDAAGGDPTGEYVYAGDEVTVLEVDGDWVRIAEPSGWIWIGCLEDMSEKGCEAR